MATGNKADADADEKKERSNPNLLEPAAGGDDTTSPSGATAAATDNAESLVKQRFIAEYNQNKKPGVEHINSTDDGLPQPSAATLDKPLAKSDLSKQSTATSRPVTIRDNDGPPSPFSSVEFDDSLQKKKIKMSIKGSTSSTADQDFDQSAPSPMEPTRIVEQNTATNMLEVVKDEEKLPTTNDDIGDSFNTGGYVRESRGDASPLEQEKDDPILIPEAVLVEDEERGRQDDNIIVSGYAEPVVPFWKQTSTRAFLCVIIVLTIGFATTLAILFSQQGVDGSSASPREGMNTALATPMPTASSRPSAPTASPAPSFEAGTDDWLLSVHGVPNATPPAGEDPGVDVGIILLIVFGCLLVLTCIAFGVFARKKSRQMQPNASANVSSSAP